ncbi:MAG: glycosyltransferase family 39 protein [Ardenticatenaceae bacterium]|nr:glycosyltransferase family 39 protein [Ardenticatenaceae bacterium]HBY94710.1 hypothetical protein [Chloroflexota bacterium]
MSLLSPSAAATRARTELRLPVWWPVAALTVLAAALRLFHLGRESLWFDEVYSIWVAQGPMWSLPTLLAWKVPFPLYYSLLHGWLLVFGPGPVALRLFSVSAGVASVPLLWRFTARRLGAAAAFWAAALLAVSPLHIWYSQEGRQYALVVLLVILAADALQHALLEDRRRDWAVYALWATAALYTHYYAGFVLAGFGLVALWSWWHKGHHRAGFVRLVLAHLTVGVLFAPELIVPLGQAQSGTWNWVAAKYGVPGLRQLYDLAAALTYGTLFDPSPLLKLAVLGLYSLAALVGISALRRGEERPVLLLVVAWLGTAPLLAFLISQIAPLFLTRYLLPVLPAYLVLVAAGVGRLKPPYARRLGGALLLAMSLVAALPIYAGGLKEDWRGVAQVVATQEQPGDLIVLVDEDIAIPFDYYYTGRADQLRISRGVTDPAKIGAMVAPALAGHGRLWLVASHAPGEQVKHWLLAAPGLVLVSHQPFQGLELMLFQVGPG